MIIYDVLPNSTTIIIMFHIANPSSFYLWIVIQLKIIFMKTLSLFILNLNISFQVLLTWGGNLYISPDSYTLPGSTLIYNNCPYMISKILKDTFLFSYLLRDLIEWVPRHFFCCQNCRSCIFFFKKLCLHKYIYN